MNIPQAPELEAAIIGSILTDGGEAIERINGILTPAMFFDPVCRDLFKLVNDLYSQGKPCRLVDAVTEARARGLSDRLTPIILAAFTRDPASWGDVPTYAHQVSEKAALREILSRTSEIQNSIQAGAPLDEVSDAVNSIESDLISHFAGADAGANIADALRGALEAQERKIQDFRSGKLPGLRTGFKSLDALTGGFQPGSFTLIAGRTGTGKTSIALHFADYAARALDVPVILFSYEMTQLQITELLLSKVSGLDRGSIRDGNLTDEEFNRMHWAAGKVERLKIRIADDPGITAARLDAHARRYIKQHGSALVLVDYLQLITPEDRKVTREQQVSAISRQLKKTALSLNVPVVCLAQLNREADGGEPQLSHLRESGALEQDADAVFLIWQIVTDDGGGILQLKIAKNRHGAPGRVMTIFHNKQFTQFSENDIFDGDQEPEMPF